MKHISNCSYATSVSFLQQALKVTCLKQKKTSLTAGSSHRFNLFHVTQGTLTSALRQAAHVAVQTAQ